MITSHWYENKEVHGSFTLGHILVILTKLWKSPIHELLYTKKDFKKYFVLKTKFSSIDNTASKNRNKSNSARRLFFFITKWQKVLLICHDSFWGLYCKENRLQLPASFQELYIEMLLSLVNKPKSSKKSKYQYFSIFSPFFKRIFAFSTRSVQYVQRISLLSRYNIEYRPSYYKKLEETEELGYINILSVCLFVCPFVLISVLNATKFLHGIHCMGLM